MESFTPKAFGVQEPNINLNPDLKPTFFLSIMTNKITHKLHAFEQDLSCIGVLQMLVVLYCMYIII